MNREVNRRYIRRLYGENRRWIYYDGIISSYPKYPDFHIDGSYVMDASGNRYDSTGYLSYV